VNALGYRCSRCGQWHDEVPFAYGWNAPDYWDPAFASQGRGILGEEQCIIRDDDDRENFFVRGRIVLPVIDANDDFEWGVWTTLAKEDFDRMDALWDEEGRPTEPPYFGWLATELPLYPTTLNLKTHVHQQPVEQRPLVELEPTDHPLAIEQREGITLARVHEIAEELLHG